MHESPSAAQLLQAVITFLTDVATPQLSGHAQFHARVSANALALVARELVLREQSDTRAEELYHALLVGLDNPPAAVLDLESAGTSDRHSIRGDLKDIETALCIAIRERRINANTPLLRASLREVAEAQLAIDQPNYSGLIS